MHVIVLVFTYPRATWVWLAGVMREINLTVIQSEPISMRECGWKDQFVPISHKVGLLQCNHTTEIFSVKACTKLVTIFLDFATARRKADRANKMQ